MFKKTLKIAKSAFLQNKFGNNAKKLIKLKFNNYKIYSETT